MRPFACWLIAIFGLLVAGCSNPVLLDKPMQVDFPELVEMPAPTREQKILVEATTAVPRQIGISIILAKDKKQAEETLADKPKELWSDPSIQRLVHNFSLIESTTVSATATIPAGRTYWIYVHSYREQKTDLVLKVRKLE